MISVNWTKIKKYEKKSFALPVMIFLLILYVFLFSAGLVIKTDAVLIKYFCSAAIMCAAAHFIHIESRMLQIYMLLSLLDILTALSAFIPLPKTAVYTIFGAVLAIAVIIIAATAAAEKYIKSGTVYDFPQTDRSDVFSEKNVMLFAPHEDDEINLYGGIIESYVKYGSTVRIVFSTNGDNYGIGKIRINEALNVADSYGIPRENIIFLGYGDCLVDKYGKHIYNCPNGEAIISKKGYRRAYGTKNHPSYTQHLFKRENIAEDMKSVILKYLPDEIFCCDYDGHADHRAISLFFEEALNDILKSKSDYRPEVFKGFAYSTAWNGLNDYYGINAASTHLREPCERMAENGVYAWADRVRFPSESTALSRIMQNSSSYKAMMNYSSQTATDHANGILNSDKVFWKRRTDSVLLNAEIRASSGDASNIASFKLVDCDDIAKAEKKPFDGIWTAEKGDAAPAVSFRLSEKKRVACVALYASPIEENKVLNARVELGNFSFETGAVRGSKTSFVYEFAPIETDVITVSVTEWEGFASLLKIEAFEHPESKKPQFIKLVDENDDFCFDYITDISGKCSLSVYSYPENNILPTELTVDGDISAKRENGKIKIICPPEKQGILTVYLKDEPSVSDSIRISNPSVKKRRAFRRKQKLEQALWSYPMQIDYYYGLIKRLAVYK